MRNRCRRCCCMNNNYMNYDTQNECNHQNIMEDACNSICPQSSYNQTCNCGFDEEDVFTSNPMLAASYVPRQILDQTFRPCVGLRNGTIFPELVSPYMPGDSMREIQYLEKTNTVGEGCNQCQ